MKKRFCVIFSICLVVLVILCICISCCQKNENCLQILLSGFAGAALTSIITYFSIDANNDAVKYRNQLELRKLFSEPQRAKIKQALMILTLDKNNSDLKDKFEKENSPAEKYLIENSSDLDDFLGLLEICWKMKKDDQLKSELFVASYKYYYDAVAELLRIPDSFLFKKIEKEESEYWQVLKSALNDKFLR